MNLLAKDEERQWSVGFGVVAFVLLFIALANYHWFCCSIRRWAESGRALNRINFRCSPSVALSLCPPARQSSRQTDRLSSCPAVWPFDICRQNVYIKCFAFVWPLPVSSSPIPPFLFLPHICIISLRSFGQCLASVCRTTFLEFCALSGRIRGCQGARAGRLAPKLRHLRWQWPGLELEIRYLWVQVLLEGFWNSYLSPATRNIFIANSGNVMTIH